MLDIKILNRKSMVLIQIMVLLIVYNEFFLTYGNPKNQPFLQKWLTWSDIMAKNVGYKNYEQKIDCSDSNDGLRDFIGKLLQELQKS